jgi:hypothetical protein
MIDAVMVAKVSWDALARDRAPVGPVRLLVPPRLLPLSPRSLLLPLLPLLLPPRRSPDAAPPLGGVGGPPPCELGGAGVVVALAVPEQDGHSQRRSCPIRGAAWPWGRHRRWYVCGQRLHRGSSLVVFLRQVWHGGPTARGAQGWRAPRLQGVVRMHSWLVPQPLT